MSFPGDKSVRQFNRPEIQVMGTSWVGKAHGALRPGLLKQVRTVESQEATGGRERKKTEWLHSVTGTASLGG